MNEAGEAHESQGQTFVVDVNLFSLSRSTHLAALVFNDLHFNTQGFPMSSPLDLFCHFHSNKAMPVFYHMVITICLLLSTATLTLSGGPMVPSYFM